MGWSELSEFWKKQTNKQKQSSLRLGQIVTVHKNTFTATMELLLTSDSFHYTAVWEPYLHFSLIKLHGTTCIIIIINSSTWHMNQMWPNTS